MSPISIASIVYQTRMRLESANITSSPLDARLIVQHVTKLSHEALVTSGSTDLTPHQIRKINALADRRAAREPIAYILGYKEFYGLTFWTSPNVFIPRPETEHLVDACLERIPPPDHTPPTDQAVTTILDVGTGSGAIAITLAHTCPHAQIYASDISPNALDVATANAQAHGATNISFHIGDGFAPFTASKNFFNIIVTNPPYLKSSDPVQHELAYEPSIALLSGSDGLDMIRDIIENASTYLKAGGYLIFEHGHDQQDAVFQLAQTGHYDTIQSFEDYGRHARYMICREKD